MPVLPNIEAGLPAGWSWRSLRSLTGTYFSGKRPKGGVAGITEGPLSLGGEHITWAGGIDLQTPRRIPETFADSMAGAEIAVDDILVVKDGATTGKTAFVSNLPERAFVNEHVFVLRPNEDALPKYLFYWLWSRPGFQQIMLDFRGAAQGGIGRSFVDKVSVPWAPIETQRRIVARIDELLGAIDDGEEELRRARQELETYRKSLLKAAVTGELTAHWRAANPPRETGEQLLQRILDERRARWEADPKNKSKRYKEPATAAADLSTKLPAGWSWASLGQLAEIVTGATPPSSRPECFGDMAPFFTPGDLDEPLVTTARRSLSSTGMAAVRPVPAGSILVTCIGATIGKLAMSSVAGATNQQINAAVPIVSALGEWIHTWLRSPFGQHEIVERASSTTMPILNKGDFSRIPIPLPPIEEVAMIATELEKDWSASRALTEDLVGPAAIAGELRQSILAAAFRGELVQ